MKCNVGSDALPQRFVSARLLEEVEGRNKRVVYRRVRIDHVEKFGGEGTLQALASIPMRRRIVQLLGQISKEWTICLCRLQRYH